MPDSRYVPEAESGDAVAAGPRRYEVGRTVARGGMGAILEARDLGLRRRVAMKVMLDPEGAPREHVLRFLAEAQVTGQLEHPGVVPVHELGQDPDGQVFYTMKFVQGATLKEILQRLAARDPAALAKYPLNALLTIFLKACDAVAFAHSRGVIHRDLKPENLMVGDFGEVLVMDWGLAKVLQPSGAEGTRSAADAGQVAQPTSARGIDSVRGDVEGAAAMTLDGDVLGTPAYMAPEQARGKVVELDARTDIYALGAVLYHILTLRPPVEGKTVQDLLRNVASGRITPPGELGAGRTPAAGGPAAGEKEVRNLAALQHRATSGLRSLNQAARAADWRLVQSAYPHCPDGRVPPPLSAVTMRALALKPGDRYATVPELQAEIEAWRGGFATAAEEAGLWRLWLLLLNRHRTFALAATVTVLALTLGLSVSLVQWRRATASERAAKENEGRALAAEKLQRDTALSAARRFAMQAIRAAETRNWDEAERRAQDAESVALNSPWGAYARGTFAAIRLDPKTAAQRFREALEADPEHAESKAGLADVLSRQGDVEQALALAAKTADLSDWRALLKAGQALYDNGRLRECQAPLARALALMDKEQDAGKGQRVETQARVQEMIDTAKAKVACEGFREQIRSLPPEEQVRRVQAKLSEINGVEARIDSVEIENGEWVRAGVETQSAVRFLYPLDGLPFRTFHLSGTGVKDLGPLKGMPLRELHCGCNRVSDLSPLRGTLLERLHIHGNPVPDLSPLKGMPLTELLCTGTQVSDLSPLQGMPLATLECSDTPVTDLGPLRGLPLTDLILINGQASDLRPLRGLPLKRLVLARSQVVRDLVPLA